MPNPRRPFTSLILVLITAIGCGAAWLLADNRYIPAIDTGIALASVGVLGWGLRKVYQEEAVATPARSRTIRLGRTLIHSLWAMAALLLNVVVGLFWYVGLPDYKTSYKGRHYYAFSRTAPESQQPQVEIRQRNGLTEEFLLRVAVNQKCTAPACFETAIKQAEALRIYKNP